LSSSALYMEFAYNAKKIVVHTLFSKNICVIHTFKDESEPSTEMLEGGGFALAN
jgi:hypothetical protein